MGWVVLRCSWRGFGAVIVGGGPSCWIRYFLGNEKLGEQRVSLTLSTVPSRRASSISSLLLPRCRRPQRVTTCTHSIAMLQTVLITYSLYGTLIVVNTTDHVQRWPSMEQTSAWSSFRNDSHSFHDVFSTPEIGVALSTGPTRTPNLETYPGLYSLYSPPSPTLFFGEEPSKLAILEAHILKEYLYSRVHAFGKTTKGICLSKEQAGAILSR
jgi:hypothetical protein